MTTMLRVGSLYISVCEEALFSTFLRVETLPGKFMWKAIVVISELSLSVSGMLIQCVDRHSFLMMTIQIKMKRKNKLL